MNAFIQCLLGAAPLAGAILASTALAAEGPALGPALQQGDLLRPVGGPAGPVPAEIRPQVPRGRGRKPASSDSTRRRSTDALRPIGALEERRDE